MQMWSQSIPRLGLRAEVGERVMCARLVICTGERQVLMWRQLEGAAVDLFDLIIKTLLFIPLCLYGLGTLGRIIYQNLSEPGFM